MWSRVARVAGLGRVEIGEGRRRRLADHRRAGPLQRRRRAARPPSAASRHRSASPFGRQVGGVDDVLDADRDAPQRARSRRTAAAWSTVTKAPISSSAAAIASRDRRTARPRASASPASMRREEVEDRQHRGGLRSEGAGLLRTAPASRAGPHGSRRHRLTRRLRISVALSRHAPWVCCVLRPDARRTRAYRMRAVPFRAARALARAGRGGLPCRSSWCSLPPTCRARRKIDGPGACGMDYPFKVAAFSGGTVGVNKQVTLACPIIPRIDTWLEEVVKPAADLYFGVPVVDLRAGSYSCRPRNNQRGAKLSEHSFGNALDVMAFVLADGREVTVVKGWRGRSGGAGLPARGLRRRLPLFHDGARARRRRFPLRPPPHRSRPPRPARRAAHLQADPEVHAAPRPGSDDPRAGSRGSGRDAAGYRGRRSGGEFCGCRPRGAADRSIPPAAGAKDLSAVRAVSAAGARSGLAPAALATARREPFSAAILARFPLPGALPRAALQPATCGGPATPAA